MRIEKWLERIGLKGKRKLESAGFGDGLDVKMDWLTMSIDGLRGDVIQLRVAIEELIRCLKK